jgi:hypothetical protein
MSPKNSKANLKRWKFRANPGGKNYILFYISHMKQFFGQIIYKTCFVKKKLVNSFWGILGDFSGILGCYGEFSKIYILIFSKKYYLQKIKPKKYFIRKKKYCL